MSNLHKAYNPKNVSTTTQYVVAETGDRFFIPVNNDESGAGGATDADSSANQLKQTQTLSPTGEEIVAS